MENFVRLFVSIHYVVIVWAFDITNSHDTFEAGKLTSYEIVTFKNKNGCQYFFTLTY